MSRKSLAKVLAVSLALLPSVAVAQGDASADPITLIVGPSYLLPAGPEFAASGDIDNDGYADAVIASTREDFVSSLLSDGDGGFRTLITFPVGRRLGDVTTLDYNGDGDLDIGAIDQRGGILTMSGVGNGAFNPPVFIRGDRLGQGIAAGDLDNQNGPDLATANGRSKNLSVFFNRGGNRGFSEGIEYEIGGNVIGDEIRIGDFNSDGWNDLVVLNVRNREADEVSLLLNDTRAQFNTVTKFLVNAKAVAMTDGDWNDDGVPDLATLEKGSDFTNQREFTVTILVTDTTTVDGETVGTGIFQQQARVPVSCPGNFNGAPIVCLIEDIESGDFNGDGFDDIVVALDTRTEQDIGLATPGLVQAFLGLGDGTFVFSTRVNVGQRPRGMAIGDVNGDTYNDIIVTQFLAIGFDPDSQDVDDNSARAIRVIPPPPDPGGTPCREPHQCQSGNCTNGVCCSDAACPAGQRCDIPGYAGMCHAPGMPGDPCDVDVPEQCDPPFCVDGFCCASSMCPTGQFCNTGSCGGPAPPGNNCNLNEQCNPPYCVDGVCCNMPACPTGQRCDVPPEGMCRAKLGIGSPCTDDEQCTSTFCTDGVCCTADTCPNGQACNVVGRLGICSTLPTPTPTPSRTPLPLANGTPCAADTQCASGNCVDDVCCASASCPPNQFCNVSTSKGMCSPRAPIDGGCNENTDCVTGNCDKSRPIVGPPSYAGTCGPPFTPTRTLTPTPLQPGDPCQTTSQCLAGFECNVEEGHLCCERLVCPEGTSCRVAGHEGFCFNLPTPTPTRLPNGVPCVIENAIACQSGNCVNDVCCENASCPGASRCDIFRQEGRCNNPLPEGSECGTNSDCAPPLACLVDDFGVRRCTIIPITPTIIPTGTPTQTSAPTIIVDRDDGGCTIDQNNPSGGLWVLALFPLFLGLRRHELRESLARRRR